jgi:hypothetical protein
MTRVKLKSEMEFLNYLLCKYQGTDYEHMQIDKIKLRIIENHGFDVSNHIIAKIEDKSKSNIPTQSKSKEII